MRIQHSQVFKSTGKKVDGLFIYQVVLSMKQPSCMMGIYGDCPLWSSNMITEATELIIQERKSGDVLYRFKPLQGHTEWDGKTNQIRIEK
jgi:hypothetical protein